MASKNSGSKRKSQLKDGITTKELIEWRAEQYPYCTYCGEVGVAIDHITPLSRGGTHTTDNLTLSCTSCNSSKYNHSLIYWLASKKN